MRIILALVFCFLIVNCISAARVFSQKQYQTAFQNWMVKHQKSYTNDEFGSRYTIFQDNMDFVTKWNQKGSDTILGLNSMADLTNQEYQRIYLGTKTTVKKPNLIIGVTDVSKAPASVDWRANGAVTAVKNQGQCGGCYSFSTTGSVEGIHEITSKQLVSLSEQQILDCSGSEGNNGCDGGLMTNSFEYIIAVGGLDTEASYPYEGVVGKCKFNKANIGATITGYKNVKSGSESDLQTAVAAQPVSVAIDASQNSFQLYSSGVYYEPACSSTQLDHGVLAVGYGSQSGQDYWIVKNSWGADWGEKGFILMARNKHNNCGIATMASYPTA
ncbi:hypothetical protein DICPUDRAFT_80649 [Dictyostelium purpureum]|uniref:Uncharacterized protein n=1 Tax=Dictyostelium purpureum TaxID=5786 RepID=F0ZR46_DICPU|nr:uncharacterized protein DICPUDRAFT_80649 [Dictyostelium purpureum]EGC33585.1 hypothetical protein DICPUDRAFT_80649 [Dictyostelium purpureum]|eukprot:XP_003289900.1 hypothetical protein DICPUDRAFT_80649 [Dictyostelium purpureum]